MKKKIGFVAVALSLLLLAHLLFAAGPSVASVTSIADSATNVTLLAANQNRKLVTIFNDSTAVLYVKFGATASTTSYTVQIGVGQYFEAPAPVYTGVIDGIWASDPGTGAARITEY